MMLNLRFLEDLNYFCLDAVLTVDVHVTCVSEVKVRLSLFLRSSSAYKGHSALHCSSFQVAGGSMLVSNNYY